MIMIASLIALSMKIYPAEITKQKLLIDEEIDQLIEETAELEEEYKKY